MVRNRKRTTDRGNIPDDVYERAIQIIEDGGKVATVAKEFNIRRMTLVNRIKRKHENATATGYDRLRQDKMIFTVKMEADLAGHIKRLANMFHGLSVKKVRVLAFKFAKRNEVSIPESWDRNMSQLGQLTSL